LRALAHDAAGLRDAWNRLPDSTRTLPPIARAAAQSFLQLGGDREAGESSHGVSNASGAPSSSSSTANADSPTRRGRSSRPNAGSPGHNQDAVLLRVLGTLCQRQQLWGKAQTYLEASSRSTITGARTSHW